MKLTQLERVATEGLSHDADIIKRVLLHESEMPGSVRLSHAVFEPGQRASPHSHADLAEVFYIISGSGEFIVDGVHYPVEAGSACRIDPGERHALINNGNSNLELLYFGLSRDMNRR